MPVKLSICVPSRNRQVYFQQTILSLIENPRPDIEFVFTDNSDDPSIMADFMAGLPEDPRIRFLPTGPRVLSMVDNWERTVAATSGDWVTVIGDDDHVDPDLAGILRKLELMAPGVEAFSWGYATFTWPYEGKPNDTNNRVPVSPQFIDLSPSWLFRRAFQWQDATIAPTHGFSVYHGAVSRGLMETIRARFNGRYFEHPTVDFDNSFKVVLTGKRFVHWQRPLSIFGACPLSISAIVLKPREIDNAVATFMGEAGKDTDKDASMEGLPFHSRMGVPSSVLVAQQWLKSSIGLSVDGWQENFARACANYCSKIRVREDFELLAGVHRRAFAEWEQGRFAGAFNPTFHEMVGTAVAFSGLRDNSIYINDGLSEARSPKDIYDIMAAMMTPLEDVEIQRTSLKRLSDLDGMRINPR